MGSNSFGNIFRFTTWGESHGKSMGVVIDGCPAGIILSDEDIQIEMDKRAPGKNPYTSPRKEKDIAQIVSGVFEGKTTGTPIGIMIPNKDADSSKYESIKDLLRPGHANFTYLEKYGIFDYRGGGRSSARETTCRVAAGAAAKKLLLHFGITPVAYVKELGGIDATLPQMGIEALQSLILDSPIFCPDKEAEGQMQNLILEMKEKGDSLGAILEVIVYNVPVGLGDPVYEKIEANIAKAMMSLPATKGVEFGSGFEAARLRGSEHNDIFVKKDEKIQTKTNYAGGTLGGITNGMPLVVRVAFKPTSSIKKSLDTLDIHGNKAVFQLPEGSRHDPCVAIRAVPILEAMIALTIADAILMNRCVTLD